MQGKTSVYETDLFAPLLERVSGLSGKKYGADDDADNAMRMVAEHSRGIAFLIADGVIPATRGGAMCCGGCCGGRPSSGGRLGLDKPS